MLYRVPTTLHEVYTFSSFHLEVHSEDDIATPLTLKLVSITKCYIEWGQQCTKGGKHILNVAHVTYGTRIKNPYAADSTESAC